MRPGRGAPPDRGFTLLELILVLFLMGLGAAALSAGSPRLSDSLRLQQASRQVAGLLRTAKTRALVGGGSTLCRYQPGAGRLVAMDAQGRQLEVLELAGGVRVELDGEPEMADLAEFYPDGSSSGGSVVLRLGERRMRLVLDPLFGEVRMAGSP